jgi:quercetin dioxygenase-like cupin family protein
LTLKAVGCGIAASSFFKYELPLWSAKLGYADQEYMGFEGEACMQPQEQPVVKIGQLEIRYLMDGTVTGAGTGMFELTVPPGARVPPAHSHRDNEEIVYVLEGTLRYSVDDEARDLKPGERMYTARGSVHAFSNPHDRPARALVILTPDIGAQYFHDIAEIANAPGGPSPAKLVEVMTRYGLVLAPPKPPAAAAS